MAEKAYQDLLKYYLEKYPENYQKSEAFQVKETPLAGRGLFATKLIEKGSLIFINSPVLIGPRGDRSGDVYCTNCYKISEICYPCSCCGLTICSEPCRLAQEHVRECNFFANNLIVKENRENNDPKILGHALIYLRSLLLDEIDVKLLKTLQRVGHAKMEEIDALESRYHISENQIKFMKLTSSILKINSFRVSTNHHENTVPKRGLYPISAFLNHSCTPNTRNIFRKDKAMAVYASKDIEIGDEILSCYTGLLWCTPARRCQLYKTKGFWCKCLRCEDSTEMGTRLSALKCLDKGCVGVLLPVTPLEHNSAWKCDNCLSDVTPGQVRAVQGLVGSLLGTMDLDDQFRLETFILERLALFIPNSSHVFVDLRLRLAIRLGFAKERALIELSDSRLALKESLCRDTLRTVAALGAGDAGLRGLLLYHLHGALAERARRRPDLYEELKSEIEITIEQAHNILHGDISAPPDLELRRRYLGPGSDKPHEERFFILDSNNGNSF